MTRLGRNVREKQVAAPVVFAWAAAVVLVGLIVLGYFAVQALGFHR